MSTLALAKYHELLKWLKAKGRLVVAYSGGIDSSLLAFAAREALGDNAHVVSFVTPLSSAEDIRVAKTVSDECGLDAQFIKLDPLQIKEVSLNQESRCYFCKKMLMGQLKERYKGTLVVDGSNADDSADERPGMKALHELHVLSPLRELGITKPMIREIASELGLPNASRCASPCLATRLPKDTLITQDALKRVEKAEARIGQIYLGDFRVRLSAEGSLHFELKDAE